MSKRNRTHTAIILSFLAFISLGLPDGLLGVAWPSIHRQFAVDIDAIGLLLAASTAGYILSSFFSGRVNSAFGIGRVLSASCALTGISLLGYTLVPLWPLIPAVGFFSGLGAGAIDAGLNTYTANNAGESLMHWLHASFGLGVTLGPIIMTGALTFFGRWHYGYRIVGAVQLILAIFFYLFRSIWVSSSARAEELESTSAPVVQTPILSSLRRLRTWVSILMFFIYTGIEVSLGLWTFTLLTEMRGVSPAAAGLLTSSYWAFFTAGRILAGLYSLRIPNSRLLPGSMFLALAGSLLLAFVPTADASITAIIIIGFAIAPIFPALVSTTSVRVGKEHVNNTIGMQIAGAGVGSAVLPTLAGTISKVLSLQAIPLFITANIVLLICFQLLVNTDR